MKGEHLSTDANLKDVTRVTLITLERVCINWRVSPESPLTVNSLSSMSVVTLLFAWLDGGCHVVHQGCHTLVEHHLVATSAHAG